MTNLVPLQVTAHLESGLSSSNPWGVALDGLLAAQLWSEHKASLRAAGTKPPDLHTQDNPLDLDLPLARCTHAGANLWHWAATTAYPVDSDPTRPPEARYWAAYIDQRRAATIATPPTSISPGRGRWRLRRIPTLVTICTTVVWHAVGDVHAIEELITPLAAIGKRRGTGEGRVLRWEVTPRPDLDAHTASHLHPNGTLGRPTPPACLTSDHEPAQGIAGLRPPYMHRARQHQLCLPAPLET